MIYWKNGFYVSEVTEAPEGALEITDEVYRSLLAAQAGGATIETGADGFPVAVQPSLAEKKADAENTLWRNYKTFHFSFGLEGESFPTEIIYFLLRRIFCNFTAHTYAGVIGSAKLEAVVEFFPSK